MTTEASLRGFKAALSARINGAEQSYDSVNNVARPTQQQLDELQEACEKIKKQNDRLIDFLTDVISKTTDPDQAKIWSDEMASNNNRASVAVAKINRLIATATDKLTPQSNTPAPTTQNTQRCKPNDALRPEKLTVDHSPVDYRIWRARFDAYYSSSNMDKAQVADQRAYLFNCLDTALEKRLRPFCLKDTPVYNTQTCFGCMGRLDEEFKDLYPLLVRRLNFLKETQKEGQSYTEFMATLRAQRDEADLARMSPDDLFIMRMIAGTHDSKLREKFLREETPTIDRLERIAREYERTKLANKAMNKPQEVNAVKEDKKKPQKGPNPGRKFFFDHLKSLRDKGTCTICGGSCKGACPKKQEITCDYCHKDGHSASVCARKAFENLKKDSPQKPLQPKGAEAEKCERVEVLQVPGERHPSGAHHPPGQGGTSSNQTKGHSGYRRHTHNSLSGHGRQIRI